MADESMAFVEMLKQRGGGDFLRSLVEEVLTQLMESEVSSKIGAQRHERTGERQSYRNGYRERALHSRLGTLELRVPKLRQGSYFPTFLEPRRLSEQALAAVIQEAWINGVSTRKVDALVQSLGMTGISKSQCQRSLKIPPFRSPKNPPPRGYSWTACLDRSPALSFSFRR